MAPPRKQEKESRDIIVSTSPTTDVRNFLENLSTDLRFEITFLNDMLHYHSVNNKYPFDSPQDMDHFNKNWVGLEISEEQMQTQIKILREKYMIRRVKNATSMIPMQDNEHEALLLGREIWNPSAFSRYQRAADELRKNIIKENQNGAEASGSGTGNDQNPSK